VDKAQGAGLDADLLTDAPAHLVASPETDVIVEVMGGDEPARTLIVAALGAGKPVVTANKHVVAHHGPELEAIARRTETTLRFEAAVAGGIPILGPLAADLAGNAIRRVRGIVNGTTNYILTAMAHEGRPYDEVLADAQELGYAEADPTGDVEGDDAVNKLVILARLAFGAWLEPATVGRRPPTSVGDGSPGITGVTDQEMEGAAALGLTIKLLATATRRADGTIEAAVIPTAVPADSPFGWTDGVTNRIEIDAEPLGTVRLAGPGAGGAATSSAVLGDLLAVARGQPSTWAGLPPAGAPAVAAIDGLDAARHWYAFVPPVRDVPLPEALAEAASVSFEEGTALRTEVVTLADARAAFDAILPAGADVTLYPVDD
jgi:homoserine dehydrogenase